MNFFLFLRVLKRNHYWRDIAVKSNRMPRYRYRLLPLGHRSGPLCVCTSTYIYTHSVCELHFYFSILPWWYGICGDGWDKLKWTAMDEVSGEKWGVLDEGWDEWEQIGYNFVYFLANHRFGYDALSIQSAEMSRSHCDLSAGGGPIPDPPTWDLGSGGTRQR